MLRPRGAIRGATCRIEWRMFNYITSLIVGRVLSGRYNTNVRIIHVAYDLWQDPVCMITNTENTLQYRCRKLCPKYDQTINHTCFHVGYRKPEMDLQCFNQKEARGIPIHSVDQLSRSYDLIQAKRKELSSGSICTQKGYYIITGHNLQRRTSENG